jgi:hypothetical protein
VDICGLIILFLDLREELPITTFCLLKDLFPALRSYLDPKADIVIIVNIESQEPVVLLN